MNFINWFPHEGQALRVHDLRSARSYHGWSPKFWCNSRFGDFDVINKACAYRWPWIGWLRFVTLRGAFQGWDFRWQETFCEIESFQRPLSLTAGFLPRTENPPLRWRPCPGPFLYRCQKPFLIDPSSPLPTHSDIFCQKLISVGCSWPFAFNLDYILTSDLVCWQRQKQDFKS